MNCLTISVIDFVEHDNREELVSWIRTVTQQETPISTDGSTEQWGTVASSGDHFDSLEITVYEERNFSPYRYEEQCLYYAVLLSGEVDRNDIDDLFKSSSKDLTRFKHRLREEWAEIVTRDAPFVLSDASYILHNNGEIRTIQKPTGSPDPNIPIIVCNVRLGNILHESITGGDDYSPAELASLYSKQTTPSGILHALGIHSATPSDLIVNSSQSVGIFAETGRSDSQTEYTLIEVTDRNATADSSPICLSDDMRHTYWRYISQIYCHMWFSNKLYRLTKLQHNLTKIWENIGSSSTLDDLRGLSASNAASESNVYQIRRSIEGKGANIRGAQMMIEQWLDGFNKTYSMNQAGRHDRIDVDLIYRTDSLENKCTALLDQLENSSEKSTSILNEQLRIRSINTTLDLNSSMAKYNRTVLVLTVVLVILTAVLVFPEATSSLWNATSSILNSLR